MIFSKGLTNSVGMIDTYTCKISFLTFQLKTDLYSQIPTHRYLFKLCYKKIVIAAVISLTTGNRFDAALNFFSAKGEFFHLRFGWDTIVILIDRHRRTNKIRITTSRPRLE